MKGGWAFVPKTIYSTSVTLPTSSQSDLSHLAQNQNHFWSDLNGEMKRGWHSLLKTGKKMMWGILYKIKKHSDIDLKCEMKINWASSPNRIKFLWA